MTADLPPDREGLGPRDSEARPRTEVVARWRDLGYTDEFRVLTGDEVECAGCDERFAPDDLRIDHIGRYEGVSNPADEELLLAVSCVRCDHRGTLTLAYGPAASTAEAEVARRIPDARAG